MDGFELNKIAGAALAAMLVIAGGRTILDIALPKHTPEKAGWDLPAVKKPVEVKETKPFDVASVLSLLPKASAENGSDVFRRCLTCHAPEKGGPIRTGPPLWGIVGRKVATASGFRYSDAMKAFSGEWSWDRLATYLHKPAEAVPGTKMIFEGVKDEADLADLLVHLQKLADTPVPLPK
jgi:cytochrome c